VRVRWEGSINTDAVLVCCSNVYPREPMSDERLFREEEIRQIFEAASTEPEPRYQSGSARNALTLRELQEIGRQVGIEPERIEQAA